METKDLIFRNWHESDADALYKMCLDEDIKRSGICCFDSVESSLEVIREWSTDHDFKAVVCKANNELCGLVILGDMNRYDGYMELEYAISLEYRRRGYATQTVNKMLDYGFGEQGAAVIAAWVRSHNVASAHLLEKCGFVLEGRLRRHARDKSDTLCYSVLRDEWLKKQAT